MRIVKRMMIEKYIVSPFCSPVLDPLVIYLMSSTIRAFCQSSPLKGFTVFWKWTTQQCGSQEIFASVLDQLSELPATLQAVSLGFKCWCSPLYCNLLQGRDHTPFRSVSHSTLHSALQIVGTQ